MTLIFNAGGTDGINSTVNYKAPTGAAAMFMLKALLKQAGWSVIKSGDGLSVYSSSADIITSASSGANGMDNPRAWFVVQMPSSTRAFCIQRNTSSGANTGQSWRIKYSAASGFTTGSPSATVVPSTGGDEQVLLGAGSDASPTMAALFAHGDLAMRFHCCADNASPYGFLAWEWAVATGAAGCAFGLDPILGGPTGDTDPYVIHLLGTTNAWKVTYLATRSSTSWGGQLWSWYRSVWYPAGNTVLAGVPSPIWWTTGAINGFYWGTGIDNVLTGKDDLLPLFVWVGNAPAGDVPAYGYPKGQLTLVKAILQAGRYTGDLYTIGGSKDGVAVGAPLAYVILPWDGSSDPLI